MPLPNGNALYYGDCLDVLRVHVEDRSVDMIYLDPPFNSNADYNVLFAEHGESAPAQIRAFEDTWTWDADSARAYQEILDLGGPVADAMIAFRAVARESDMLAYLSMMAPRLIELRRVLKEDGALFLHCDPTASHYLKILLDAIFRPERFRNEVIWKRTSGHSDATKFGRVHDVILYYANGDHPRWNKIYQEYDPEYVKTYYRYQDPDGRMFMSDNLSAAGLQGGGYEYEWRGVTRVWRVPPQTMARLEAENRIYYTRNNIPRMKRYLDEAKGMPAQDVINDIEALRSWHQERLGYPTQKPEALLDRLILATTNEGDTVLDPFCGCGTTVASAQRLGRRWVGIDITHLAIALIRHRLTTAYPSNPPQYDVIGEPVDMPGAIHLASTDRFQFQFWALGRLGARPTATEQKKGADQGIDGRIYFQDEAGAKKKAKQVIFSVKSGKVSVRDVRDLVGVCTREKAEIGVLITLEDPTGPMMTEAASAGIYTSPGWGTQHPKIQILKVEDILLHGAGVDYPVPTSRTLKSAPVVVSKTPEEAISIFDAVTEDGGIEEFDVEDLPPAPADADDHHDDDTDDGVAHVEPPSNDPPDVENDPPDAPEDPPVDVP